MEPTFDLMCLEGAALDILLQTPRVPLSNEKLVVEYAGRRAGGLVANTACAAARLGLQVGWAGHVGGDEGGRFTLEDFTGFGVDTRHAEVIPEATTDFTVILIEPGGERTILVVPTMPALDIPSEALLAGVRGARMVYTVPRPLHWFSPLAETVHKEGGLIALDVEMGAAISTEALNENLRLGDLIFCNPSGLVRATGTKDPEAGAQLLLAGGARCVAVTLGSGGAWAFTREAARFQPAYSVEVVDTTGAGDCFHAAFMAGYLADWPLLEILQFANAAAALAVQKLGPRAGFATQAEIWAFMEAKTPRGR
jgi:sugar/nucleoside kinase (ribokinase family)